MRPSTIWYTLKQGIKNIKRNFMFSIASIITMAACIFLFGIFFSIVNNVNTLAHKVEEDVPITVLFNEGTTQEQMDAVGELIRQRPEVSKIEFESGDKAWEKMKQEYFGDDSEAADGFKDDNPLANSSNYRVYMNNIEKQSELVAYIKTLDNVREVNQSEQAAKTLGSINRIVSYVSVAVIVILLLIAIFLISNTVTMGITVRREEIAIMKYIGAKDGFVRAPFVFEGLLIGAIGAVIPLGILYFVYEKAIHYILEKFHLLQNIINFLPVTQVYRTLLPVGILLGVGIGFVGSFFTIRKHLKV